MTSTRKVTFIYYTGPWFQLVIYSLQMRERRFLWLDLGHLWNWLRGCLNWVLRCISRRNSFLHVGLFCFYFSLFFFLLKKICKNHPLYSFSWTITEVYGVWESIEGGVNHCDHLATVFGAMNLVRVCTCDLLFTIPLRQSGSTIISF